jgi:hypothetical protein
MDSRKDKDFRFPTAQVALMEQDVDVIGRSTALTSTSTGLLKWDDLLHRQLVSCPFHSALVSHFDFCPSSDPKIVAHIPTHTNVPYNHGLFVTN